MNKQMSLSVFIDELAQVWTKKKNFWSKSNASFRGEWIAIIQPSYYKGERGNNEERAYSSRCSSKTLQIGETGNGFIRKKHRSVPDGWYRGRQMAGNTLELELQFI